MIVKFHPPNFGPHILQETNRGPGRLVESSKRQRITEGHVIDDMLIIIIV